MLTIFLFTVQPCESAEPIAPPKDTLPCYELDDAWYPAFPASDTALLARQGDYGTYDVQGDVQLLDDTETYALCFNPSRALPSPPITPRTTTKFTSQVLVPFLKLSSSTRWETLACSSLWFQSVMCWR
jgi:hypothetical protein